MDKILGNEEIEVLKEVRGKISDQAVILGGAVRDQYFGKPYKDIDIFLPMVNPVFDRWGWGYIIDESIPEIFGSNIKVKSYDYLGLEGNKLLKVYAKNHLEDSFQVVDIVHEKTKYQLIFTPKDVQAFKTVDFNCNFIQTNGTVILKAEKFKKFVVTKQVQSYRQITKHTAKRLVSLLKKYPEWTLSPSLLAFLKDFESKKEKENTITAATVEAQWVNLHEQMQNLNQNMNAAAAMAAQAGLGNPIGNAGAQGLGMLGGAAGAAADFWQAINIDPLEEHN